MALSDEERRAKNAEKQRIYRARKAAEREAEKATASNASSVTEPPSVALVELLAAMRWLTTTSPAAVSRILGAGSFQPKFMAPYDPSACALDEVWSRMGHFRRPDRPSRMGDTLQPAR